MSEHQPRATPTLEGLQQTFEAIHAAGGLIMGSLGRAAIYEHLMGLDPNSEFIERSRITGKNEQLLTKPNGKPRDVDMIGPIDFPKHLASLPHPVDPTMTRMCNIAKDSEGKWSYIDFYSNRHYPHQDCFKPIECELTGIRCVTVRAATHLVLVGFSGKQAAGRNLLIDNLPDEEREFLGSGAYGPLWTPSMFRRAY